MNTILCADDWIFVAEFRRNWKLCQIN